MLSMSILKSLGRSAKNITLLQTGGYQGNPNYNPYSPQQGIASPARSQLYSDPVSIHNLYDSLMGFYRSGTPIRLADNLDSYIRDGYQTNSDLYSIITYILRNLSTVRIKAVVTTPGGGIEDAEQSEAQGFIDQYYSNDTEELATGFLLLTGNSYLHTPTVDTGRDRGRPMGLEVLPSQIIEIVFGDYENPVRGYKMTQGRKVTSEFGPEAVTHIKFANFSGDESILYGMAPLQAARNLVNQSNSSFIAQDTSFRNMGPPHLITAKQSNSFSPHQGEMLQERMQTFWGGLANRGKVPPMTPAALDVIKIGLSPVDLNTLESQRLTFEQLCRPFGFPVTLLDSKSATLDNMKVADKVFWTNCVIPLKERMIEALNKRIVPRFKDARVKLVLDTSHVEQLQADKKQIVEWMKAAEVFTQNQILEALGEERSEAEGMDEILVSAGRVPLSQLVRQSATPEPIEEEFEEVPPTDPA